MMNTISIQGVKGSFHDEAAQKYFQNPIIIDSQMTFSSLINSVKNNNVDYGIIAVENTISGTIHSNFNLIKQSNLEITGEVYLSIKQNLAVLPGVSFNDLDQVQSHYMAINQCRDFFKKYPHIKLIDSTDTAHTMQLIANKKLDTIAAIGSKLAAEYYGLNIIAESIESNKENYTRFLILRKKIINCNNNFNKVSLCITVPNLKGSLAKILNIIYTHDIDLSKIESIPIIGEPWNYSFYLDLIFNNCENYFKMIYAINPFIGQLDVLGKYLKGEKSFNQIHKT
jgi:prephenate dehydratase